MTHEELKTRHYENLNTFPHDPEIGKKWDIDQELYTYFFEILPPLKWKGCGTSVQSFYMAEFYTDNITTKFSMNGDKYFCEWVRFNPFQSKD